MTYDIVDRVILYLLNGEIRMLAREHNKQTNVQSDMFITYRYKVSITESTIDVVHNGHKNTEFYIPSLNLCFNKQAIFKSNNPRNSSSLFDYKYTSPLTKVNLPVQLIEKIQSIFELHRNDKCFHPFSEIKENEELSALFKNMHLSVKEGRILDVRFLENEKDFEFAYKTYGNSALLPYMLKYLNGQKPPHQKTINRILEIIHSLDQIEKESLKNSLSNELQLSKDNYNDQSFDYLNPAVVGLASFGTALAFTENPIIGIGAGLFAGGITFFKKSSDLGSQKMQRDQLKDRFFDALVSSPRISFDKQ